MRLRVFISLVIILVLSGLGFTEQLILVYPAPKVANFDIKVLNFGSTSYISVTDLAKAYKVRTYYRKETGKIVLFFPGDKIKVSSASTFVMVGSKMMHMPQPALLADKEIFVPVYPFMSLLKRSVIPILQFTISDKGKKYTFREYKDSSIFHRSMPRSSYRKEFPKKTGVINLTSIQYEEKKNGLSIKITTTQPFRDSDFSTFFRKGNWFYLTIYGGYCDSLALSKINPTASIERVEAITSGNSVQFSFKLRQQFISSDIHYDLSTGKILLSLFLPLNKEIKKKIEEAKTAWIVDTIVIDPGHGGKDPGTPGRWGYKHEKDIVLDIALRLGKLLEKRKDLKVVYTRKKDVFIPLWKRTEIANKSEGKLFLSLHVDACKNKSVNGICLYLLSSGKSKDAVRVAEKENSVIQLEGSEDKKKYEGYDDISNILANMVHSVNMKDSEKFAEIMSKNLSKKVSQKNRGVKQANFYVLVGASMPKVLCEFGFNSNRAEARKLNSRKHRQLIAESLYKSIIEFKEMSDRSVARSN
ncbi:MAG: hypothetical protein DRP89_00930 [Candidatus Neomarinimicrobiota bacterium]|nr:MAG: hypothetical protein DRP89_00930 [Candidatus Neomarinimicrobiota bacterium]